MEFTDEELAFIKKILDNKLKDAVEREPLVKSFNDFLDKEKVVERDKIQSYDELKWGIEMLKNILNKLENLQIR